MDLLGMKDIRELELILERLKPKVYFGFTSQLDYAYSACDATFCLFFFYQTYLEHTKKLTRGHFFQSKK